LIKGLIAIDEKQWKQKFEIKKGISNLLTLFILTLFPQGVATSPRTYHHRKICSFLFYFLPCNHTDILHSFFYFNISNTDYFVFFQGFPQRIG